MPQRPYVHLYSDVLDKMPLLARGSNAAVYFTIGALNANQQTADLDAIAKYTGLSARTIENSMTILLSSGMVENKNGNYTAVTYMENKKNAHNVCVQDSLSLSQNLNQSFSKALQELSGMLLLSGGISAADIQDFNELWSDYPDPEIHARAIAITLEKAGRPNYKYYRAVVQSGAQVLTKPTTYPQRREKITRSPAPAWTPPTEAERAAHRARVAAMHAEMSRE